MSIFLVALGLTLLLAIAGFAVDLANLYVARNEAQRAADAAALAGANEILQSGYPSGLVDSTTAAGKAATHAAQVGNQNLVIGLNPDIDQENFNLACPPPTGVSGGCFNFSIPNDPRITVVVKKDMPTYFMKVFGISTVPVSVKATAEVYTPSGADGPTTAAQCLKPWLLPNCDPGAPPVSDSSPKGNHYCSAGTDASGNPLWYQYFVDPNNLNAVMRPGLEPTGVVGEHILVKTGIPTSDANPAPGKFWPVYLPSNGTFVCPDCASTDQASAGSNSASLYRENIECCSTDEITCGTATIQPIGGNMVGPTGQGVQCLIHQGANGSGQDYISLDSSLQTPFIMYAGTNNPYPGVTPGSQITTSDSLVSLPMYDGSVICPGNSCPASTTVNIVGFLQLFIQQVVKGGGSNNDVYAYVLNVSGCGSGTTSPGGTGSTPVPVYTGSPIPVRLIHN